MDVQYATNANPDRNPYLAEHFLDEIHAAYRHSRGCFLLVSLNLQILTGKPPERNPFWEIDKYLSETTRPRLQYFLLSKVTDWRGVQRWLGTNEAHFRNVRTAFEPLRQHG